MRWSAFLLAAMLAFSAGPAPADAQFFRDLFNNIGRGIGNVIRPVMGMFGGGGHDGGNGLFGLGGGRGNRGSDGGTKEPVATGHDNPFPDDCGRDDKNKGKLCFPDGLLCQKSKRRAKSG